MAKNPAAAATAGAVLLLLLVAVAASAAMTEAAAAAAGAPACNPARLMPCSGPVLYGGAVPPACCAALRAEQRCLCGYARSPNYGMYIRSPNTAKVFAACKLPMPRCA